MGDRNNPIKFGPEWLRNMPRERNTGSSGSSSQNISGGRGNANNPSTAGTSGGGTSSTSGANNIVQLADNRYGKEEMLALYDKTVKPPPELKNHQILYQRVGKPPSVLNNSFNEDEPVRGPRDSKSNDLIYLRRGKPPTNAFENDMRENLRGGPPIDLMSSGDRLGLNRGAGRGLNVSEGRGRGRLPFVRPSTGRLPWQQGGSRMPGYGGGPDEELHAFRYRNNTNVGNVPNRNNNEQLDRNGSKMFRNRRQGTNTNWRQSREEGEEWRTSEANRARSSQQEKWERDWGDRLNQDRPQSWNRRWVGRDSQNNDDNLPEWAVDNAESCAGASGTFDSSGAFHGYSNDDTYLPKSQDSSYPLTRSHTHDSFARSKTSEQMYDEWWALGKSSQGPPNNTFNNANNGGKFRKQGSTCPPESGNNTSSNPKPGTSNDEYQLREMPQKADTSADTTADTLDSTNINSSHEENFNKQNTYKQKFNENKSFDSFVRPEIDMDEVSDERGNIQSVMITPNNSLRQKHQNIVSPVNEGRNRQGRQRGMFQGLQSSASNQSGESDHAKQDSPEDKIVEEIFDMTLEGKLPSDSGMPHMNPPSSSIASGISNVVNAIPQVPNTAMQLRSTSPTIPNQGLPMSTNTNPPTSGIPAAGIQTPGIQSVLITNSALNASLGLPLNSGNNTMGMPMQGVPTPILGHAGLQHHTLGAAGMQAGIGGIPAFQTGGAMAGLSNPNITNNSLFLGQNPNNTSMPSTNEIPLPNSGGQSMFPMHNLAHPGNRAPFSSSMHINMMQPSQPQAVPNTTNLNDQWYYEDPEKNIQGPFSSKEMYNWYRAGFFRPSLMVRRACEAQMRPLGSYGPVVPFSRLEMVMNVNENPIDSLQFGTVGSVGLVRQPPLGQQQMVDSLWSHPYQSSDVVWMQQAMSARSDEPVNNFPMYFWDQQPSSTLTPKTMLPEEVTKEIKTEAQILAQLRATLNINPPQNAPFMNEQAPVSATTTVKPEEPTTGSNVPNQPTNTAPNLEELQKLIHKEPTATNVAPVNEKCPEPQPIVDKVEHPSVESNNLKSQVSNPTPNKTTPEVKTNKQVKNETDKSVKVKENTNTKSKGKKSKESKKEEESDVKIKEEEVSKTEVKPSKSEKKSNDTSQTRSKKEDKLNKKELENQKKEWIKEGFTIVKGPEKNTTKDNKKKAEDVKAAEEQERKKREEEKLAAEEDKKKKQAEAIKKHQEQQQQQQRQASESVIKKAPWSAATNPALQATQKEGPTLAEIQRLEREKKLEQIKEQQQMMQIIAQQQAVALAWEQEMNAGLGWAKKKGTNLNMTQSLPEIQAAATAAAAASRASEDAQTSSSQSNHVPWGNTHNGGGFWDTPANQPAKPVEKFESKPVQDQSKNKKKLPLCTPKKEPSATAEFESWCTSALAAWNSKIDVPTFIGFLKDIESPYEIKDYVKCYLGDSKDSNDFARQFLERRSKLLRVGMTTPSDDLCSPAVAVNPRTQSGSDHQEVKGKGKKSKKNKMLKVDARILGFSVTAAEDRINVGDIDTV